MTKDDYPKRYLYKRLIQAKLFIDKNYADPIDIETIAREASFSKFHFIRLFSKTYGKTPHTYLTSVRLNKAKEFLQKGIPVSDVCFVVGFESLSSFSGFFKRFTGISPSAFFIQENFKRKQILEKPLNFIPGCFTYKHGWNENSNFGEVNPP